ncbi:MAG: 4Fe-4S dicluster domain-containing protein [Thermoplasmataceae archaeon]
MAVIIYLTGRANNLLRRLVIYLLLAMMNGMLVGPFIYLWFSGTISLERVAEFSVATMTVEMIPFLSLFLAKTLNGTPSGSSRFLRVFVIFFVIVDEIIMSIEFGAFSQHSLSLINTRYPLFIVASSVTSYWFVIPMSIEMAISSILLRKSFSKFLFFVLVSQSAIMLLTPAAFQSQFWSTISIYLSASVMTAIFIVVFEYLYRVQHIKKRVGNFLILLLLAYSIMMAGVFVWLIGQSPYLLSAGSIFEMIVFLTLVLNPERSTAGKSVFWLASRRWSFSLLLIIFVPEFFMGAAIDLRYFGVASYISSIGLVPIAGSVFSSVSSAVFDFVVSVSSISLSPWFLIMMGIEMGSLVVFKIKITHDRETKLRLFLMLLAYGVYTVYLPSFFLNDPAKVPFLGWSMGIGTAGPVSPIYLLPIFLSYVITAVLSLFFGSRQLCSAFCPASTMYQGTFYDSMKKFNNGGNLSRSVTRSNRRGKILFRSVSLVVYFSMGAAALISYLNSTGVLDLTIYGYDPEFMIYLIIFGFVWYAAFIAMPFIGSYGCINTGFCSWGNFNRFFSKLGFFRLRVTDPQQCISCKTKDCATVCPVGNYGQPGSFILKGEFKDSRCVGIGDCVEACPYDNIFYYDVRHWIRGKIGKDRVREEMPEE